MDKNKSSLKDDSYNSNLKDFFGIVKWFSPEKGFGFITSDAGDIFAYYTNIVTNGFKVLTKGQRVKFNITKGERGPEAINIIILNEK